MTYRAILLDSDGKMSQDHWELLSLPQWRRLATWSLDSGKDLMTILQESRFMVEQDSRDPGKVNLFGMLPHCGLYGCLHHDGSTHT